MISRTIDIGTRARRLYEDDVAELNAALDEIADQAEEEYGSFEETPESVLDAFDETQSEYIETKGTADALVRTVVELSDHFSIDDWMDDDGFRADEFLDANDWADIEGLCEFTITEFSGGALAKVQDEISDDSFDFDPDTGNLEGMPKQGRAKVVMLEHGVTEMPDAVGNIANLNSNTFEYLFDKLNELNTAGSTDLGNSSLRERMN